ncbi:testis-expressed protein 9 [Leucoraja erinacea]|uniref:testis-expressed protein 9 n=1 Tax=Leucoraja erinaceus TaxID=7782 RepID=UPI002456786A|nr:testis-expressed protein 9 [Leucoraja erinacea]
MEGRRRPASSTKKAMSNRSGSLPSASAKKVPPDLLTKEEEYKKLNAELEAKTAELVRQAEEVMKGQEEMFSQSTPQNETSALMDKEKLRVLYAMPGGYRTRLVEHNSQWYVDEALARSHMPGGPRVGKAQEEVGATSRRPINVAGTMSAGYDPEQWHMPALYNLRSRAINKSKVGFRNVEQTRPCSESKGKKMTSAKHKSLELHVADDVAVPEDFANFSLAKTISKIEGQLEDGSPAVVEDVIMPGVGNEMSTGGSECIALLFTLHKSVVQSLNFLKGQMKGVAVNQLGQLHSFPPIEETVVIIFGVAISKDDENNTLTSHVKEVEEERIRLQKATNIQQSQIEKYKSLAEEAQKKSDGLQQQALALQKELETQKRAQKQFVTNHNATEVRLNRALEETDKYKAELNKVKQSNKDITNQEKLTIEQLKLENNKLEKQKNELMTGFKKQMKLIDILKRQKMHVEAAKLLSFTEEEFIKALEWGN